MGEVSVLCGRTTVVPLCRGLQSLCLFTDIVLLCFSVVYMEVTV